MNGWVKKKKTVAIDVTETISLNGYNPMEISQEAIGSLYEYDTDAYIMVFEVLVGEKSVIVTIKVAHGVAIIVGIGDVHSRRKFELNEWHPVQFSFDTKTAIFRTFTKKLDYALTPEGGIVEILYELWSGDTHLGYYNYELFIR